ncbi:MAG: nicotinate phosphoribosyltransferase [Agathobaculum sp.]|uniref:nicotinate phosphoribosyltransferase n=1 Tax=Agathobaculum sp. TaxID=2048138 RepID=UPI002A825857|nr:nicotinate phosphoribosyltransferase [Agathobaculum sp.]MDY3711404.1 nicotinate phosphoribosyltransferase [Agathobaculum sp.]
MIKRNLTMLTDFYEFTMAHGYFEKNLSQRRAYFDMFFRRVPDGGGYAIMAGVEQLIDYLRNLHFTDEDIAYLRRCGCFSEDFLQYLREFTFACDVWAVPEGTPVFPGEPLLTVAGPMIQAQFVETMVLLTINHQTLIATKANRITRAAQGRTVLEFGSRRAQGYDGAVYGARASYIGGCHGTACVLADRDYGVPAGGTMAHSWVQMFDSEYEAFKAYADIYPDNCVFLVDTFNVLKSGVPNAIRVAKEMAAEKGIRPRGIRLDSGDIAYLSIEARKMLDEAGFSDMTIMASNSLDEYIVRDLLMQGAKVDSFGIGERMITSKSEPVFGGVYKLAAVEDSTGRIIPKIKVSENVEKITTPHFKQVYRLFDNRTGKALGDVITVHDETIDPAQPYTLFDPIHTWKQRVVTDYTVRPLRVPLFKNGRCVYQSPAIDQIRSYCAAEMDTLWEQVKRFENPQTYFVDLSKKLWDCKHDLLAACRI